MKQLNLNDDDIIIVSDLDEIPDRNIFKNQKINNDELLHCSQDFYYYNLNVKIYRKWIGSKLLNYYTYVKYFDRKPNHLRDNSKCTNKNFTTLYIEKGGWHFSYFGNINFIKNKLRNFAHHECQIYANDDHLKTCINNSISIFPGARDMNYLALEDNDYLPEGYEDLLNIKNF